MRSAGVQTMQGSDGKTHLLDWTGRGKFKPYCCTVRKVQAVKIKHQNLADVKLTCIICATRAEFLLRYWREVEREETGKEIS